MVSTCVTDHAGRNYAVMALADAELGAPDAGNFEDQGEKRDDYEQAASAL